MHVEMKAEPAKSLNESSKRRVVCLTLALATLGVYWQTSGFAFTNYDEFMMVLKNPMVTSGLTLQGFSWALGTSWFEYWHPLTWMSHMVDCEVFGLAAGGHHLVSVGLHVANALLLFTILSRMTGLLWRSAFVAALFALHPLHVESVAWIAERKDVLSTFFFLLSLWAYVRYVEESKVQGPKSRVETPESTVHSPQSGVRSPQSTVHSPRSEGQTPSTFYYALALAFFACGLMSKPMVVTLPFVLILLDYWPLRRLEIKDQQSTINNSLRLLREKIPFFALSLGGCLISYFSVKAGNSIVSAEKIPWSFRLANAPVSYVRYLLKAVWPVRLSPVYPLDTHWTFLQVGGAVLMLALISLFVLRGLRAAPY
ncbi:MAG TPA: hypothetical protein VN578_16970, partial [Candidatus Binatia bacterium]|nr:hypothetical protein [Candidatus Binatia bacterium]